MHVLFYLMPIDYDVTHWAFKFRPNIHKVAILSSHLTQKNKAVAVALHCFTTCSNPLFSSAVEKPLTTDASSALQVLDVSLVRLVLHRSKHFYSQGSFERNKEASVPLQISALRFFRPPICRWAHKHNDGG